MNVTNRQKSTDAETPPSTQTSHHQHQQLLAYISCRQVATVSNKSNRSRQEGEQEQLVTSTSADSLLPLQAEGEGEEVSIELESVVSSPAHITSSTHNYDIVTDSLEEMVVPSTSENARLETEGTSMKIHANININNRSTKSVTKEMVARDINTKTVTDVSGRGSTSGVGGGVEFRDIDDQSSSTSNNIINSISHSEKNKIILKLPKLTACESQMISTNEDDLRKVEPLKINLHNAHHHHHTANVHHTPKISIKPILEDHTTDVLVSSEECSSSAEDEIVSKLSSSEPHILPKLTIRAKNEDYGSSHTTVVPKLTIKINDCSTAESLSTSSAANTPPLPKLTIKTGQDGHTESIITNVSPASSTTSSSSSLASSSSTSSSSANFQLATSSMSIPKLTIKPIQKVHEPKSVEPREQQPSIPKLCIKTMICTDAIEETSLSKIPKLTIKTGQEHAVIITQHSEHVKSAGIPKMTIKTKSLDMIDDSNVSATVERIPKLTIKTNNANEIAKICRNKVQSEPATTNFDTPLLSPKHQTVPKLTISKQLNQIEKSVDIVEADLTQRSISKISIKSQNMVDCNATATIKSLPDRPSSAEESGVSDDPEDEEHIVGASKLVPKLTIKNLGSPQQKLKVVVDSDELNKKGHQLSVAEDVDEFTDLLNVDNVGGESSNSQEFCGFNENINNCTPIKQTVGVTSITTSADDVEIRRQSDDMDIDETLKIQHEPQMFQNITQFNTQATSSSSATQEIGRNCKAALGHIIDTVDLTSSAGSSPSHRFDYNDDEDIDNKLTEQNVAANAIVPKTNILMECLQRETTVIQNTQQIKLQTENKSIPPPLQPKPNAVNKSPVTLKYPQLAEHLMANGSNVDNMTISAQTANNHSGENIIDSIEILDTPEGSPRNSLDDRLENVNVIIEKAPTPNGLHYSKETQLLSLNNNNLHLKRHASVGCKNTEGQNLTTVNSNMEELPSKLRRLQNDNICATIVDNELNQSNVLNNLMDDMKTKKSEINLLKQSSNLQPAISNHQRSRKQKHEHLLPIPMDEVVESVQINSSDRIDNIVEDRNDRNENATPVVKKRGRPKKLEVSVPLPSAKEDTTPGIVDNRQDYKSRRVQLLRKRLAIDMVDAEQQKTQIDNAELAIESSDDTKNVIDNLDTSKRERSLRTPLRTSRRSNTPIAFQIESKTIKNKSASSLSLENRKNVKVVGTENELNYFIESNSSISSASSHSSSTLTSTMASMSNNVSMSMASQIDLTMSSSSSNSNGSTTNTITTVEATTRHDSGMIGNPDVGNAGGNSNNSMLPPTTILSSSDPLPDVIFRPNDFSSIIATQQLRGSHFVTDHRSGHRESQEEEIQDDVSGPDNSEDDSASSSSMSATPGRGRGRLRGSRGGRSSGRGHRSHHLGRGASATAKVIAMNRPRCVGGALKHTPDPDRIKGLYSPAPQVFEEDTRMSADLSQSSLQQQQSPTHTSQLDFFTNEESQSSVISNTSILDPNNIISVQSSAVKKPMKKKKMEVCVAEDADFTVASIAEYDWPPPKGCCPSKNRDTFMIQEQVAMYLGIKSFKRKYPDLPRRQVDMEERNWLQEKGLVSEKMCDLGITAVWASDILDIMYTDFYDKYEEYKDFVRQKHLREIEAKQKSLGLNVAGRGLQARERALLSTSKWNSYFNRTRKDERLSFLDLQTLIVNKPCPPAAPISTIRDRPIAEAVALAAKAEHIAEPPTLLKPRVCEPLRPRDVYYPLSLVPGQFCGKYYDYSARELRRIPLNTVLDPPFEIWQHKENESNSSDTDSAVESIDNKTDAEVFMSKCYNKRRLRRKRQFQILSTDEFKIPPIPGASTSITSSTDSCSSSDGSSSETDSESSCTSSSSEESSEDESLVANCGVCRRPHNRNLYDVPELFVQCYTCRRKVHPSCIEMPLRMTIRVRNYNWQCADCKCCMKCKLKRDQNKMLFCEQCDRGFHIYCLGIKSVPEGRWSCNRCSICMRCGATTPQGLPQAQQQHLNSPNGENFKQVKPKKCKWVNEYRMDHVTKFKEHLSMLCVPCARMKSSKRVNIATYNNTTATILTSAGPSNDCTSNSCIIYSLPSVIGNTAENITNCSLTTVTSGQDTRCTDNKDTATSSSSSKKNHTSTAATTSTTTTAHSSTTVGPPPVVA